MGHLMGAAAEAVPVDASSNEVVFGIVTVIVALLAVAVPVGLLVGVLVVAGRVRRHENRLAEVEARLSSVEGRQTVEPSSMGRSGRREP